MAAMTGIINQELSCLSVLRYMDAPRTLEQRVLSILYLYFDRKNIGEMEYSLWLEHVDLIVNKKNLLFNTVYEILTYKTVLQYLADDFPELKDIIQYSQFMKQLDITFGGKQYQQPKLSAVFNKFDVDSWTAENLPLRTCAHLERMRARSQDVPESHFWWKVIENPEKIDGIPIDICRAQYENAKAARMKYVDTYILLGDCRRCNQNSEIALMHAEDAETAAQKKLSDISQDIRELNMLLKTAESQLQFNKTQFVLENARKGWDNAFYDGEKAHNQTLRAKLEVEQAEVDLNNYSVLTDISQAEYMPLARYTY